MILTFALTAAALAPITAAAEAPEWLADATASLHTELTAVHGEQQAPRIERGLAQVAAFWRAEDGDRAAFEKFVGTHFAGDQEALDTMFDRYEALLEKLDGHMLEILLAFREQVDLDAGPIAPYDEIFSAYNPGAHVSDDLFANKLAFAVLLNFPVTTLEQRLTDGNSWSRRQWAEARLSDRFAQRVPAAAQQAMAEAGARSDQYIAEYNIWMHHLLTDEGERLFPPKLRLLSHWNLRDEIKAAYSDPETALPKQRMIQKVMERIVTQTIPAVAIDNPHVDWKPYANEVSAAAVSDTDQPAPADLEITNAPEPDTRYDVLHGCFKAAQEVDKHSPTAPTLIERRFNRNREIPEQRVAKMFESLLGSPLLARTAQLIEERLGRPLEPFDIWYSGFRPRGTYTEEQLNEVTRKRYPTPAAYEADMPNLLVGLGFSAERAQQIAANIVVDPARGSGHAWGAAMRGAKAHLRTRVGADGMDYKGFNIAVHEMGHNVEQTVSLNDIDHVLLQGVPNTAFTEALAFVFQSRDMELLGLAAADENSQALQTLDDFWGAAEIAAVALVDMKVWHWMYAHPDATAAELKEATLEIAKGVWNRYYAPIFDVNDVVLLGIYSHMIHSFLYLPDYPIGHLIAHQIEEQVERAGELGPEFERMAKIGNVAPDLWMQQATGAPVGPEALLHATEKALDRLGGGRP